MYAPISLPSPGEADILLYIHRSPIQTGIIGKSTFLIMFSHNHVPSATWEHK